MSKKVRLSKSDKAYYACAYLVVSILLMSVLYPLLFIVSASFSSASAVNSGRVILWPVEFSADSYSAVFKYNSIFLGYRNTIFYTAFGTLINIAVTFLCAYPLSRKTLMGKRALTLVFTFTMIFSGGMIPSYILMRQLKIINTPWAMLLPGAMSVYNMIVTRTFFQNTIPDELLEASKIDGCSDAGFFARVVLPLSKAIIAVITLYYAVGHWNSYFNAFLYLSDRNLYPLQIFLRQILIQNSFEADIVMDEEIAAKMDAMRDLLKYAVIVVSTAPLLCAYPFVQRYFVQGVMIGSLKG